jgi:hypothetical protein
MMSPADSEIDVAWLLAPPIDEMQSVLDQSLENNTKRPHQGCGMDGRIPIAAFIDGIRKENNTPQPEKPPKPRPPWRLLSADYPLCTIKRL